MSVEGNDEQSMEAGSRSASVAVAVIVPQLWGKNSDDRDRVGESVELWDAGSVYNDLSSISNVEIPFNSPFWP